MSSSTSTDRQDACDCENSLPGQNLDAARMPGHWLLARMGKKILRPGGLGVTRRMLGALAVGSSDRVVEFAPGLGVTAGMVLASRPSEYTAIERDAVAAEQVKLWLNNCAEDGQTLAVHVGQAQRTGLPDGHATVVYGEAMLSMQSEVAKREIIREAFRLLEPGGRYGIHELCVGPDNLPESELEGISRSITEAIHHRALPLSVGRWISLLESEGFEVLARGSAPMALLEPCRLIKDEGLGGALRFFWNVLRDAPARARVLKMRHTFRRYRRHLSAVFLVVRKPRDGNSGAP